MSLRYDRAGRSDGNAFVTYAKVADARTAIREFDGANAKGQPIRLTLLPLGPGAGRARLPGRRDNLVDRVENPRTGGVLAEIAARAQMSTTAMMTLNREGENQEGVVSHPFVIVGVTLPNPHQTILTVMYLGRAMGAV